MCWIYKHDLLIHISERTTASLTTDEAVLLAGNDVIMTCDVAIDQRAENVTVVWLKDGEIINRNERRSLSEVYNQPSSVSGSFNSMLGGDLSLKIRSAEVKDTGNYTCRVTTELDSAKKSVTIVVKG